MISRSYFRSAVSLSLALLSGAPACGGREDRTAIGEPPAQGTGAREGEPSASGGGGAPDCFENPQTHFELINACTSAVRIRKTPALTLLRPDGSLPRL